MKIKSNDLTGMKLYHLANPDWIDEEMESDYYVIEKDGKFYGWMADEYTDNMIASLLGDDADTGLIANSMNEMIEQIDECYE